MALIKASLKIVKIAVRWECEYVRTYCMLKRLGAELQKRELDVDTEEVTGKFFVGGDTVRYKMDRLYAAGLCEDIGLLRACLEKDKERNLKGEFEVVTEAVTAEPGLSGTSIVWSFLLFANPSPEFRDALAQCLNEYFQTLKSSRARCLFIDRVFFKASNFVHPEEYESRKQWFLKMMPDVARFCESNAAWSKRLQNKYVPNFAKLDPYIAEYEKQKKRSNVFVKESEKFWNLVIEDCYRWEFPADKDEWDRSFEDWWQADAVVEASLARRQQYELPVKKRKPECLDWFCRILRAVKAAARPMHYVSVLNQIWRNIMLYGNIDARKDIEEAAYRELFVSFIKQELGILQSEGVPVRRYYIHNDFGYHPELVQEFFFYKDKLEPKEPMVLGLRELKRLGIPGTMRRTELENEWGYEAEILPKTEILTIWENSQIRLKNPEILDCFHKELLEKCPVELIIKAAKCGIFPKTMHQALLDYILETEWTEKYPVAIWLAGGGLDEEHA